MLQTRYSKLHTWTEILDLAASLKCRAGIILDDRAGRDVWSFTHTACWWLTWAYWPNIAQGRGWHRFSPRKKAAARSFARAVVAARKNRVKRARKEA